MLSERGTNLSDSKVDLTTVRQRVNDLTHRLLDAFNKSQEANETATKAMDKIKELKVSFFEY